MLGNVLSRARASAATFFAVLALGCQGAPESYGRLDQPIVSGVESEQAGVVALLLSDDVFCSGALITPRVVVTAAHCVRPDLEVFFGTDVSESGPRRSVVAHAVHPAYEPATGAGDVGVLLLGADAPAEIPPLELSDATVEAPGLGEPLAVFGFGRTEHGDSGVLRSTHVEVSSADGDPILTQPFPGQPCRGDSGGPALVERGSDRALAGVISRGDSKCESYTKVARIDRARAELIDPFVEDATRYAAARADGQTCALDSECESNFCVGAEPASTGTCASRCTLHADQCGSGQTCVAVTSEPVWGACVSSMGSGSPGCSVTRVEQHSKFSMYVVLLAAWRWLTFTVSAKTRRSSVRSRS